MESVLDLLGRVHRRIDSACTNIKGVRDLLQEHIKGLESEGRYDLRLTLMLDALDDLLDDLASWD